MIYLDVSDSMEELLPVMELSDNKKIKKSILVGLGNTAG